MNYLLSVLKRAIRTVLTTVVVLLLGVLAVWYFFLWHPEPDRPSGAGPTAGTPILPTTPKDTVRAVYHYLAAKQPPVACALFDPAGAAQFAGDFKAKDCESAMRDLAAKVTDPASYGNPKFTEDALISDASASVSSCTITWPGAAGPKLGAFSLTRQQNGGWIISGHQNEPADCVTG